MDAEQFVSQILAEPANLENYQVYADWLIEHGQPCGELMQAQLHHETSKGKPKKERAVMKQAIGQLIAKGDWAHGLPSNAVGNVRFKRGFVTELYLNTTDEEQALAASELLAAPVTRMLNRLHCKAVADAYMHTLAKLPIKQLDLRGSMVTDQGLAHLAGHASLRQLFLQGTSVTAHGLAHIAAIPHLQSVNLAQTTVDSVAPLAGHKSMRELDLTETAVRDVSALASMPALRTLHVDGYDDALLQCTQLTELSLCEWPFEIELLPHIGQALTNLRNIRIRDCDEYWGYPDEYDDDDDEEEGIRVISPWIIEFKELLPNCTVELF